MRRVSIPRLNVGVKTTLMKPASAHSNAVSLVRGDRRSASQAFSKGLGAALEQVARTAGEEGWWALWGAYIVGDWVGFERTEMVEFTCQDERGGDELMARLLEALEQHAFGELGGQRIGVPSGDSHPTLCGWESWTFGPKRGVITSNLESSDDCDAPIVHPDPVLVCPKCGGEGRPVYRVWGYPVPEYVDLSKRLGEELDLMGCIPSDLPELPARCSGCRAGLFPGHESAESVAEYVLVNEPQLVPKCPRLFVDHDDAVWTPDGQVFGTAWNFRMFPGIADRLDLSARMGGRALVALRPMGGAVLFLDWRTLKQAFSGGPPPPYRFRLLTRSPGGVVYRKQHVEGALGAFDGM